MGTAELEEEEEVGRREEGARGGSAMEVGQGMKMEFVLGRDCCVGVWDDDRICSLVTRVCSCLGRQTFALGLGGKNVARLWNGMER